MITIHWRIRFVPKVVFSSISSFCSKCRITFRSLTYNHFMDQSYVADVCMGPMFWVVDNFTNTIGTLLVVAVIALTLSVVIIAYWIGIPYWWHRNYIVCIILVLVGHWLLLNISFHYYMAVVTHPGFPPQGELITEAVSICKKCISPKPPRTHHCSVCNRCILKMDHHCPWLNNCVGHRNHRYFFLYMVYMVIGVLFIIFAGCDIAYTTIMLDQYGADDPELEGHSVLMNRTGALIPVINATPLEFDDDIIDDKSSPWRRKAVIYMALINCGVFFALGALSMWHAQLIGRGETSIEAHINKTETDRMAELGKLYKNPYNFGRRKNWKLFLGLVSGRTFLRHVLLPSTHEPVGDGLTWYSVHEESSDDWP